MSYNGKQERLWNKIDLYSSYRQAQSGKAERERLETENRKLRTEISNPQGSRALSQNTPQEAEEEWGGCFLRG